MVVQAREIIHKPNSTIQELYLSSWVDEVGGFGKKGWGKSWAVLHEPLGDIHHPDFSGVLFRRTSKDFADLWAKAILHYQGYRPDINETKHLFTFPSGARYLFSHLQHIKDVFNHNGQEYQLIVFDELPQFPALPYLFMIAQLRGANPQIMKRIRATGNWLGEGVLFVKSRFYDQLRPTRMVNGEIQWGDIGWFKMGANDVDTRATPEEERDLFQLVKEPDWQALKAKDRHLMHYMSREWYAGDYKDNPDLMKGTPDYEAKLAQLNERERRAYMYGEAEAFDQDGQLVLSEWWETAISGQIEWNGVKRWNIGGDYAPGGKAPGAGDNCVKFIGQGNRLEECEWGPGRAAPVYAGELEKWVEKYGYQCLAGFDANGPGTGVWGDIAHRRQKVRDRIMPLVEKDKQFKARGVPMYRFDCLRSQMWWAFREDTEAGLLDLSFFKRRPDILQKIQPEIMAHTFKVQKGGIIRVIPKEELKKAEHLGKSPDFADGLIIWNWIRRQNREYTFSPPPRKHHDYGGERKVEDEMQTPENDEAAAWT